MQNRSAQGYVFLLVLLHLSAVLHIIDHSILVNGLEDLVSLKGTALSWFWSHLIDYYQFVALNGNCSKLTKVVFSVP